MDFPTNRFLKERGVPHQKLVFPPDTEKDSANVTRALSYKASQMVLALIFRNGQRLSSGDSGRR